MFCPSCGTEYSFGLPYCNRCGANLNSAMTEAAEPISINLTKAIAGVGTTMAVLTLGGFMTLIIGAVKLAEKANLGSDPLIVMMAMGMATILIVDILLARQLSRLIETGLSSGKGKTGKRLKAAAAAELGRPITSPLPPSSSVTDHTTRFLEHQHRVPASVEAPTPAKEIES